MALSEIKTLTLEVLLSLCKKMYEQNRVCSSGCFLGSRRRNQFKDKELSEDENSEFIRCRNQTGSFLQGLDE